MSAAPLEGIRVLDLSRLLPGRLLLAAAGRLRRRRRQGRGHRHGRLRPLVAARTTRAPSDSAEGALFLALNRNKRSVRIDLKTDGRPRGAAARWSRDADVAARVLPPGRARPPRRRLRARCARSTRGLVYCAITRLRAGRPAARPLRARHELPRPGRPARRSPASRRPADPGRRPDRRPRRRRAHGRLRHPRRAARARPHRRGPARRRLDGRRRAVVAGDGRRRSTSRRRACRGAAS